MRVELYRGAAAAAAGSGGGGGAAERLTLGHEFTTGGAIGAFQVRSNYMNNVVAYWPNGGPVIVGADDTPLIYSPDGGSYKVRIEADADKDLVITRRKRSAAGSWSTLDTVTLPLASVAHDLAAVTLAAGEALGLHVAPSGGGAVSLAYWRVLS